MQSLVATRGAKPFADIADLAARLDPRQLNKMSLENLARAGAFDSLDPNRARLFAGAETILRRAQAQAEEKDSGQIGLFGGGGQPEPLRLPALPDWPQMERLQFEAEAVGFHLTAHPMDAYLPLLRRMGVVSSGQLEAKAAAGATRVKLAGTVVACKERPTRSGSRMAWLRLSDQGGGVEITLFSEVLARARDLTATGTTVLATVDLRMEGETLRITCHDLVSLEQAAAGLGARMRIWLDTSEAVPHIRAILTREKGGRGSVVLVPRTEATQDVEITLPGSFNVTPRLAQALKLVPGVARIEET
jgi:DNA polymerase-3 subunit alpha